MPDPQTEVVERRYPRATIILLALAAGTVTAIGLSGIRAIAAPVLLTLVLTICAQPVRTALERRGISRGLATGSVVLVVFALLAGLTYILVIAVTQFVAMLPDYAEEFNQIAASIGSWLKGIGVGPEQVEQVKGSFDPATIAGFFSNLAGGVASITAALVIVLTMLILMSADATYVPTILGQVGLRRPRLADALIDYARNVRRYMVVTTFLGLVQGAINGIALWLLHVPAAVGSARLPVQLHPQHRLLHRDHPAAHLRILRRWLGDPHRGIGDLCDRERRRAVDRPAACRRQRRRTEPVAHLLLRAVLGDHHRADRRRARHPADVARAGDPHRLRS